MDPVHGHVYGTVGGVHSDDALHDAALVSAVADHAGNASGQVVDGLLHLFDRSAPQQHKPAGHSGSGGDGAAAEGGQLAGVFLDIHTDQIAQGGGAQKLFFRIAVDSGGSQKRHSSDDPMGSGAGDAHGRTGKTDHAGLDRGVAEKRRGLLLVTGYDLSAVFG